MKTRRNYPVALILVITGVIGLLGLLTWGNYRFVKENPGGNDFLVHWAGTRALVTEGLNPYSDAVALKIQNMAYGRPAENEAEELRFLSPLYSVVLFLPFALVEDFSLARALWMTAIEACLALLMLLSIRLAGWRVRPVTLGMLVIFTLFWYHGFRPLITGNAVVFVALGLVGGLLALRAGADELAGVLFAFTTIKPNVVVLALAFVVLWAAGRGRWRVVGWMVGTLVLLAGSAALLIPAWIVDNLREVIRYTSNGVPGTPREAFIAWWPAWGSRVGWALTAVMALFILIEWWSSRKANFQSFLWTFCLTLTAAQWIGIKTDPGNFVVLYPALMLVFALLSDRWRTGGRFFIALSGLLLFLSIWGIFFSTTVQSGGQPVQSPVLFFPLPLYLLITLYWVRWWAVEPPTVWYDQLDGR